jgi:hypothetical protein
MRAILCDMCKKIIEEPLDIRTISCTTQPLNDEVKGRPSTFVWVKEVCLSCAMKIEEKFNSKNS